MPLLYGNYQLAKDPPEHVESPLCPYGDRRVVQKECFLDLRPRLNTIYSTVLERVVSTGVGGTATLTTNASEMLLSTRTTGTASYAVTSIERCTVYGGIGVECMIGVRFASASLTTGHHARWGLFDGTNGFFFQLLGGTLSVGVFRNSVATLVNKTSFNIDTLDGTGVSGQTLDLTRGNVFRILIGADYGQVVFGITTVDTNGYQRVIGMHQMDTSGSSVPFQHQPLRLEVNNNGVTTTTATTMNVMHRSVFYLGVPRPPVRYTAINNSNVIVLSTAANTYVMLIRKKAAYTNCNVYLDSFELAATTAGILMVFTGGTTTSLAFTTPNNETASETAIEVSLATGNGTITTVNSPLGTLSAQFAIQNTSNYVIPGGGIPLYNQEICHIAVRGYGSTAITHNISQIRVREVW